MASADPTTRVWELMEKIGFCMFTTHRGGKIHSRPMSAITKRDEDSVYFLTNVDLAKDDEIEANPEVCLAFADPSGQKYVSLNGRATVSADKAKIHELWSPFAKAWFDGEDDPRIRVIRVAPDRAEFWDAPGTLATYVSMIVAAVTDTRPTVGENRKVSM